MGVKAERPKFLLLFAWSWKESVCKKHDFKARLSIVPPTRAFRLEFREAPNRKFMSFVDIPNRICKWLRL